MGARNNLPSDTPGGATPHAAGYAVLRQVAASRKERGDLLGALQAYRHAEELAGSRGDGSWRALLLCDIGELYDQAQAHEIARSYYAQALAYSAEVPIVEYRQQVPLPLAAAAPCRVSVAGAGPESARGSGPRRARLGTVGREPLASLVDSAPWLQSAREQWPRVLAGMAAGSVLLSAGAQAQEGVLGPCGEGTSPPPVETSAELETAIAPPPVPADGTEAEEPTAAEWMPAEQEDAEAASGSLRLSTEPAQPPPGHTRSIAVPRVDTAPVIDGHLDDTCWQRPTPASAFWVSETGRAPQDATEVWVVADEKALHVAFRCRDSRPEAIFAEQTKRDGNLGFDDRVTVQIDPYHNHRSISDFSVNALGTQADSMAGGRARKIEWKGEWKAAAVRTPDGWTAEFIIPFSVLNYTPGARTFGVNFLRYQHRTQETSRWADVTPALRTEEMGHLTGLRPPARSAPPLSIMTYTTGGVNTNNRTGQRQPFVAGTGLDLRYNVANNLTGMASLYPDFSQVEDEVTGLAFSYNEKLLTDRRPFFQEGSAFFGRSRTYFHSGRIPDFNAGAKMFGRLGPIQMGFLGVTAPGGRSDYVARAVREFGPRSSVTLMAVQSQQAKFSNQLLALEGNARTAKGFTASFDAAFTRTQGRVGDGTLASLSLGRQTPYLQYGVSASRTGQFFFPADGFIAGDQLGTLTGSAYVSYQREYADHRLRTVGGNLGYSARNTLSGLLQNRNFFVDMSVETRSQRQLTLSYNAGPYRPRGKNPGQWSKTVNQDHLMTASLYFNTRSSRGGYGVSYARGQLGGGRYSNLSPSFWWKPSPATSLSYSYERAFSFGTTRQGVLNLSWDLDRGQSVGLRWVDYQGKGYWRVAFRRVVVRGVDVYAVYNKEPDQRDRFVLKLVRSLR